MTSEEQKSVSQIEETLSKMEENFKNTLPEDMPPKKFIEIAISFLKNAPKLLGMNRQSLYNAIDDAAEVGLYLDGREAALAYFKDQVKFMPMIGGYIKKLSEVGIQINSQIVHKEDSFKYWTDEKGQHILHEPKMFTNRGEGIGAYCIATMKDGRANIEIMSKEEIMKVKECSKQQDSLMWTTFWTEGWKKTVTRRAWKWLPKNKSTEMLLRKEEGEFEVEHQEAEPVKRQQSRLEEVINNGQSQETTLQQEAPKADKPPLAETESVEGTIEGMKIKAEGNKNRFVCQIGKLVYGTYDEKLYREQIVPAADNKFLIRVSFTKVDLPDMIRRDITMIEFVTAEEHFSKPENKEQKPKKDIPL